VYGFDPAMELSHKTLEKPNGFGNAIHLNLQMKLAIFEVNVIEINLPMLQISKWTPKNFNRLYLSVKIVFLCALFKCKAKQSFNVRAPLRILLKC